MATQSKIPNPKNNPDFLKGVYDPQFIPQDLDLVDFIQEVDPKADVRKSLENKSVPITNTAPLPAGRPDIPVPLTEAEAEEADRQIQATLDRIAKTRTAIREMRSDIGRLVNGNTPDGGEYRFKMDVSRKRRVRRAIKQLFGYKTDTLTYSMYQELLEAKQTLETEEGSAYTGGKGKKSSRKNDSGPSGKKTNDKNSTDKEKKKKGFLQRGANLEDPEGPGAQEEEQYMRMFPKLGRDFVYRGDLEKQIGQVMQLLDPLGKAPVSTDITEAKKRAREYKAVIDSGKDGSQIYRDIIKLDDD